MAEHSLDARGLICPLPVLKARKILLKLPAGDTLRVQMTDKAAPKDFQLFCAESGHTFQSVQEQDSVIEVVVVCGRRV
jgi:tRNA 2-thiouridine synthesizing protein A